MKVVKGNILAILCIGILVLYAFIEFETLMGRILFISTVVFFIIGLLLVIFLPRFIILQRYSGKDIVFLLKYEIIIWIISAIILLSLGGFKLTGAFFLGLCIYAVFTFGYYWIRFGRRKKDPGP